MDRLPTFRSVFGLPIESATKAVAYFHMVTFGVIFVFYFGYQTVLQIKAREILDFIRVSTIIVDNIVRENALLTSAFFAGTLVFGIRKKNSDLVLSWLLLQVSTILISVLTLPFTLIPHFVNSDYVLINGQLLAFIAIKVFALLVVNSYYSTLAKGNLISEEEETLA